MSSAVLERLKVVLSGAHEADRPNELISIVNGDVAAAAMGFPPCIIANDRELLKRLSIVSGAIVLRPFTEVSEQWSIDELRSIQRAGVLIAGTNARQLLPSTLINAIQFASAVKVPIALLVDGVGRLRDPAKAAEGVAKQLSEAVPSLRFISVCLGDARFFGPEPEAAVASALVLLEPETREMELVKLRVQESRLYFQNVVRGHRDSLLSLREHQELLRDKERAAEILAQYSASSLSPHLNAFHKAIASIDTDTLVNQACLETTDSLLVNKVIELLRENATDLLNNVRVEVEEALVLEIKRFSQPIDKDLSRAREVVMALEAGFECELLVDITSIPTIVEKGLDCLVQECLNALSLSDGIRNIADWISKTNTFITRVPQVAESEKGDDSEDIPSQEDTKPSTGRVREVLAGAGREILINKLKAALADATTEAQFQVSQAEASIILKCGEAMRDVTEQAYKLPQDLLQKHAWAVSLKLDTVLAILRSLDALDGFA